MKGVVAGCRVSALLTGRGAALFRFCLGADRSPRLGVCLSDGTGGDDGFAVFSRSLLVGDVADTIGSVGSISGDSVDIVSKYGPTLCRNRQSRGSDRQPETHFINHERRGLFVTHTLNGGDLTVSERP